LGVGRVVVGERFVIAGTLHFVIASAARQSTHRFRTWGVCSATRRMDCCVATLSSQ
jgi:hypothetical protein